VTLKQFRDKYLLTNQIGRVFVTLYYKYSPEFAFYIHEHAIVRKMVRIVLYPILKISTWFVKRKQFP